MFHLRIVRVHRENPQHWISGSPGVALPSRPAPSSAAAKARPTSSSSFTARRCPPASSLPGSAGCWTRPGTSPPTTRCAPIRADPRQRNIALRSGDVAALTDNRTPPLTRSFLPRLSLSEKDQMRALICDGASLLGWVDAFRERPFARVEQRLFGALVPALQRRLSLAAALRGKDRRVSGAAPIRLSSPKTAERPARPQALRAGAAPSCGRRRRARGRRRGR